jgi:hypothetical protein
MKIRQEERLLPKLRMAALVHQLIDVGRETTVSHNMGAIAGLMRLTLMRLFQALKDPSLFCPLSKLKTSFADQNLTKVSSILAWSF